MLPSYTLILGFDERVEYHDVDPLSRCVRHVGGSPRDSFVPAVVARREGQKEET